MGTSSFQNGSRRAAQRRFAPGTLGIRVTSQVPFIVIGWVRVPAEPETVGPGGWRRPARVASWDAVVLGNGRVDRVDWQTLSANWTLEEWMELESAHS